MNPLFLFLVPDACFWQAFPGFAGAFLLGIVLFWWLFYRDLNRRMTHLLSEKAELQDAYDLLKKQKGSTESLALTQTFLSRRNTRSGEGDYGQIFSSSNLDFVSGLEAEQRKILKENSIIDWKSFANANPGDVVRWLDTAGLPTKAEQVTDWQQQVTWAITGNWVALQQFQDAQIGDDEVNTRTQLEEALIGLLGFSGETENLTIFEGIDQEIQATLNKSGIHTWNDLAIADVSVLNKVLISGEIKAEPGNWPKQAKMAMEGKWMELSRYQDQLHNNKHSE